MLGSVAIVLLEILITVMLVTESECSRLKSSAKRGLLSF